MDGGGETAPTAQMEGKGFKKGPWAVSEDAILSEYVRKHGEGNWNAVQKNSGLLRCGKSCRLRWANHLRPNLKKGSFTADEENLIIELHSKMGNKWARMASQLPGRTDNEIKNFWNTRLKRRERAGLPLYPHEIQHQVIDKDDGVESFEFDTSYIRFQKQDVVTQRYANYFNTSYSFSSFSSSSSQPSKKMRLDPLVSTNPTMYPISNSLVKFPMSSLYNNNLENVNNQFGFSIPLSSSSSSNEFWNPNHFGGFISENSDTNNNYTNALSCGSLFMGDHDEMRPSSFPLGKDNIIEELISYQNLQTHSFNSDDLGNCELIDDLLEDYHQDLLHRGLLKEDVRVSSSDLCEVQEERMNMGSENRLTDHFNPSHQSSIGTNPNIHKYDEPIMVDIDDDFPSLPNNSPSMASFTDWHQMTEIQNEASYLAPPNGSVLTGNDQGNIKDASSESCYWSNMPRLGNPP